MFSTRELWNKNTVISTKAQSFAFISSETLLEKNKVERMIPKRIYIRAFLPSEMESKSVILGMFGFENYYVSFFPLFDLFGSRKQPVH